ncbi:MAG: type 1 glutamine amidotransferase [Pseudomonadota bacterium]
MKIGILQTGYVLEELEDEHGTYPEMFAQLLAGHGFEFESFAVLDGKFPNSIHDADGWLITGSKYGAYEDHSWIPPLEDLIRDIYQADIPLAGICFGHQIMAQALGGKVEVFGGQWGLGNTEYIHSDGSKSRLHAFHQDQVTVKPADATVTASNDFCEFAALSYKNKAISIQPHPEFSAKFLKDLIDRRIGTVLPVDQAEAALESLSKGDDSARIGLQIAQFFKEALAEKAA